MTLHHVTRWFGPQRMHNPLCQRCIVISRQKDSQSNKQASFLRKHGRKFLKGTNTANATQLIVCTARIWCGYASPIGEQHGCTCGVCLEKISYLFGGTVDPFSLNALVSCEVYDITLNEWQSIAPYKFPDFTEVQSFYEIRYTYLAEPEVKVLIGIILVWWGTWGRLQCYAMHTVVA